VFLLIGSSMALYTSAAIKYININLKSQIGFSRLRYLLFTLVPLALLAFIDPAAAEEITTTTANPNGLNSTSAFSSASNENCISYDSSSRIITIRCKSATLTDINNQLNDNSVLDKQADGIWLLNAGITIANDATLIVDSKDTTWLKIVADGTIAYPIEVFGGLKIDSVKVTSWNPETNDYVESHGSRETSGKIVHPGAPRPYIRVEKEATGTTDITNSEIAYLGYEGGWGTGTSGIHYHLAGHGSVIRNNDIHHLYFGFYSVGVGGMVIENNKVHDMGHYGIDPHTGTHDMVIRNNTVYGNNGTAIICSLDCYNILIEKNVVYNNTGSGIGFSRNMTNSIARDNYLYDQSRAIHVSRSHNNEIYNNTVSNAKSAIVLVSNSSANKVHDNYIMNAKNPLRIDPGLDQINTIYANRIDDNTTPKNSPTSTPPITASQE
jgi:poly(beta-D-mannuronate) C5 epimerase